jgi:hypothetical protein
MYWPLFLLFRFFLRRDVGALGIADVLLLVLIAGASQNAMSGGYESIADGCLLALTGKKRSPAAQEHAPGADHHGRVVELAAYPGRQGSGRSAGSVY